MRTPLAPGLAFLAACDLSVANVTEPRIDLVYSTPSSIEQTVSTRFQTCHNGRTPLVAQGPGIGMEGAAAVAARLLVPREAVPNYPGGESFYELYSAQATNGRIAANVVTALDRLRARGGTLGTPARDLRARAFGLFALGCNLGVLAMVFDSASITTPGLSYDALPALSGAADVMRAAIAMLDTAIALASAPEASGTDGFPLPSAWVNGSSLTSADFVRLARSFRARFRAGVARTPAERSAVNWPAVIADAQAGAVADFTVNAGNPTGWVNYANQLTAARAITPWYYGMADVSGGYDAWLATPLDHRAPFLIVSPDRRWPQGATRAAQQAIVPAATFGALPYVVNRLDDESITGAPWTQSYYTVQRMRYFATGGATGPFVVFTRAELDLLMAEGYLRGGDIGVAAAKIDLTRVGRGQLPALSGVITSMTQPVPGGANCVPRVPVSASGPTACGTIWEAMKWKSAWRHRSSDSLTGTSMAGAGAISSKVPRSHCPCRIRSWTPATFLTTRLEADRAAAPSAEPMVF